VRRPLVAVAVLVAFGGCGKGAAEERAARGETVYVRECARCHMVDGSGVSGVYPNLAGNPIVTLESPEPVIETVLEGREAMPAFGGRRQCPAPRPSPHREALTGPPARATGALPGVR